jgi:hypothetical protein
MTTETTTQAITELKSDIKKVYNVGPDTLEALASKYNVSTRSLDYARQHRDEQHYATVGRQAFRSNSDISAIQRTLYATIKGQLKGLGA